ncbi:hypothetical protein [Rhodanobacter aciditrophus]|jgi:hypothetical protein|uniref:hypothetical protein n=1 Tax=Rhodanobacter aciditrophus TaxID=1623218 RepID=UPI003CE86F65
MRDSTALAALAMLTFASPAWCSGARPLAPELRPLDITAGTWVYHGENLAVARQKAAKWTWLENCKWSATRAFMACSFTMSEPGKVVKSLAVSTYNYSDKSYWHYEMFDSDGSGAEPFIARMTIEGDTWTAYGNADNKTYRVVYHYASPTKVRVSVELSSDKVHWTMLARGEGIRQP